MDAGLPNADATLHAIIRQLPVPLVLFGTGADVGFANDRFSEIFLPGQLDRRELLELTHAPGSEWVTLPLQRHDGGHRGVRGRAIALPYGVLVVIDDSAGELTAEEYERLQHRIAELENLSATDRLTGAWNRVQLERMVTVEISRAQRLNQPVTLILIDIDHFKRVNDVHGHLVGDAVLKEFAARIRLRMRATDSLFRWGGEEFVILAPAIGYRGAGVLAEDLRAAIAAKPFATVGPITASLGVAEYMEAEGAESWFRRTDQALYVAKNIGRNCVHLDRRGTSDLDSGRPNLGVVRLNWLEAYECGEATIDAEHRELFELGNALLAAAVNADAVPGSLRPALDALLAHVVRHFQNEEAVLARHGYSKLVDHQRAHAVLLHRAGELAGALGSSDGAVGDLVNFLVRDVVARHLFTADRQFYPLFAQDRTA